jgi:activator of 2-hydroxyglutaryl-CoA dehydratase
MTTDNYYMGIDLGSVSLNVVVVDAKNQVRTARYHRTEGRPLPILLASLEELATEFSAFQGIVATGSGRKLAIPAFAPLLRSVDRIRNSSSWITTQAPANRWWWTTF